MRPNQQYSGQLSSEGASKCMLFIIVPFRFIITLRVFFSAQQKIIPRTSLNDRQDANNSNLKITPSALIQARRLSLPYSKLSYINADDQHRIQKQISTYTKRVSDPTPRVNETPKIINVMSTTTRPIPALNAVSSKPINLNVNEQSVSLLRRVKHLPNNLSSINKMSEIDVSLLPVGPAVRSASDKTLEINKTPEAKKQLNSATKTYSKPKIAQGNQLRKIQMKTPNPGSSKQIPLPSDVM